MNHDHMNGMTDLPLPPPPSPSPPQTHHHPTMHMTFFWSTTGQILFPGWPGSHPNPGIYFLVLLFIFFLAFLIEFLSHSNFVRRDSGNYLAGVILTVVHTIRAGLAYMVMLAVMSFNGGVFLSAVGGHALGFLVFGTWVFKKRPVPAPVGAGDKSSDLAPMICG